MTNKEAIEIIKRIKTFALFEEEAEEAFELAVEALEEKAETERK